LVTTDRRPGEDPSRDWECVWLGAGATGCWLLLLVGATDSSITTSRTKNGKNSCSV